MDKLVIRGGNYLRGSIPISGSKNAALPLMSAALLGNGTTVLNNIPHLRDIRTFSNVLRITGARVQFSPESHQMHIDASNIDFPEAPYELVKKMRASFYMLGALLGRRGQAKVSLPGGCAWGPRPVDLHMKGLQAFGASIDLEDGYVMATTRGGRLDGGRFKMTPSSVGATINLMLGAVTARGGSIIENAATEPDVVTFGEALVQMGARIEGLGTHTIEIEGVDQLQAITFTNASDRIELGTYMIAAAMAGKPGEPVRIENAEHQYLGQAFKDAFEQTGTPVTYADTYVDVTAPDEIKPISIETGVYPGFPTDLQAQWTVLLTQSQGNAKIRDTIYYDRFKHIPELQRMGINAIVVGNEVVVEGSTNIKGTKVMSTDLRASVSLVLAGMVAKGETQVLRIYHLDRGYENLEGKLSGAGIDIKRVKYDEWAMPEPRAA